MKGISPMAEDPIHTVREALKTAIEMQESQDIECYLRRALTALDSLQPAAGDSLLKGFRLVPEEPTEEMCIAALNSWHGEGKLYMAVRNAMLKSAPSPE